MTQFNIFLSTHLVRYYLNSLVIGVRRRTIPLTINLFVQNYIYPIGVHFWINKFHFITFIETVANQIIPFHITFFVTKLTLNKICKKYLVTIATQIERILFWNKNQLHACLKSTCQFLKLMLFYLPFFRFFTQHMQILTFRLYVHFIEFMMFFYYHDIHFIFAKISFRLYFESLYIIHHDYFTVAW